MEMEMEIASNSQVPEPKYKCPFCSKKFELREIVNQHKNEFHLNIRPHECQFCFIKFYTEKEVRIHVIEEHPDEIKTVRLQLAHGILICPVCKEVFSRRAVLRFHILRFHQREGPKKCKHFGCNECFWSGQHLMAHMDECKLDQTPKIRVISDAKFTADNDEYDVIMDSSSDEGRDDKESTSDAIQPEPELESAHDHFSFCFQSLKLDNYECCECSSEFDHFEQLLNHLEQHSEVEVNINAIGRGDGSFHESSQCLLCEFVPHQDFSKFHRQKQMQDHVIAKHFAALSSGCLETPELEMETTDVCTDEDADDEDARSKFEQISVRIRCKLCFKEFDKEEFLRIHIKYHHHDGSESQKALKMLNKCHNCSKSCHNESQLRLHTSLYCDVIFECDFCNKIFNKIKLLADHVRLVHRNSKIAAVAGTNGDAGSNVRCNHPGCEGTFRSYYCREYLDHCNTEHRNTVTPAKQADNGKEEHANEKSPILYKVEYDECPFCDKLLRKGTTNPSQILLRHMVNTHKEECSRNGATCNVCDFTASNITVFVEHYKKHYKNKT